MISQFNTAAVKTAMSTDLNEQKETKKTVSAPNAQLTDENKVEKIKGSISSGEYKIDLVALSEKMAQDLL